VYKLSRVDIDNIEEILKSITSFAREIKKKLPIKEVYLYGSFSRGEIHEGSDIDLLIVGNFKERLFDRIGKILELTDLPVEPLVYTVEEFEEMKRSQNPFILDVLKTAVKIG